MTGARFLALAASIMVLAVAFYLTPERSTPLSKAVRQRDLHRGAHSRDTPRPPEPVSSAHRDLPKVDAEALREEADRLIHEGRVRRGLDVFRKAVEADPSAKNHGDLGELLYKLTALDEAAVHLRAAAELDPGNADRWIALANLYYRKVDLGEAWEAEARAREAEPGLQLGRDSQGLRVRK